MDHRIDRLIKIENIKCNVEIQPSEFVYHKKVCAEKIHALEGKIFSEAHGYIIKILCVDSSDYKGMSNDYHTCSVIYSVNFQAMCYNPRNHDTIECTVVKIIRHANINGVEMIAREGPTNIFIIPRHDRARYADGISLGDKVLVNIAGRIFDTEKNLINVVGRFY